MEKILLTENSQGGIVYKKKKLKLITLRTKCLMCRQILFVPLSLVYAMF